MLTSCRVEIDICYGCPSDYRVGGNRTILSLLRRLATGRKHSDHDYHLLNGIPDTERPKPRLSRSSSQVGRDNSVTAQRKQ